MSKTLEYAFDDWCIAQLAGKLERVSDGGSSRRAPRFYRNVFDRGTGFMRPRLSDGSWQTPFSPRFSQHENGRLHRGQRVAVHVVGHARREGPDDADGRAGRVREEAGRAVRPAVGHRGRQRLARHLGAHRPVRPRQRAQPSHRVSLRVCRRAVEDGGAREPDRDQPVHDRARKGCAATRTAGSCRRGTCSARWVSTR